MLTVYSKENCPFCVQAKNLLTLKKIPFTECKIDADPAAREFIVTEGHRTVPQIYKDGKMFVQGGFQGLSKLTEEELKAAL